MELKHEIRLE